MRFSQYIVSAGFFWATAGMAVSGELTVSGSGTVSAIPDVMTVSWVIEAESPSASEAYNQMAARTEAFFSQLGEIGLPPADIKTTNLNISERYSQKKGRSDGYIALTGLSLYLGDLSIMDSVINLASQEGMGSIRGISFDIADPKPLRQQARALAVQDAIEKAKVYAEAAGVTLGDIQRIWEGGFSNEPSPMFEMARVAAAPVSVGSQSVSASINITFEIE